MKNKSIQQKYKGKSFAEISDLISAKYPNREVNEHDKNSFEAELGELIKMQKISQQRESASNMINQYALGTQNSTFDLGNPMDDTLLNTDSEINLGQNLSNTNSLQSLNTPEIKPLAINSNLNTNIDISTPIQPTRNEPSFFDKAKQSLSKFTKNDYAPALIGQGINTALNAALLSKGADKETPNYNENNERVNAILANLSTDNTAERNAILSQRNAGYQNIRNQSRTPQIESALLSNFDARIGQGLAESEAKQSQINNQYKTRFASILDKQGSEKSRIDTYNDDINAKNKAAWQNELSKLGVSLADSAKFASKFKVNETNNEVMSKILSNKYKDFGLDSKTMANIIAGKGTKGDLIALKEASVNNSELEELNFTYNKGK